MPLVSSERSHRTLGRLFRTAFLALALALCGCAKSPQERASETLKRVGADQLRRDGALLYKTVFAAPGLDFVVLKPKYWPASFLPFAPVRVGAYPDGISVAIESKDGREAGLYIVPATMDLQPSAAHGGRFERLAEGVYWYSFGD